MPGGLGEYGRNEAAVVALHDNAPADYTVLSVGVAHPVRVGVILLLLSVAILFLCVLCTTFLLWFCIAL